MMLVVVKNRIGASVSVTRCAALSVVGDMFYAEKSLGNTDA